MPLAMPVESGETESVARALLEQPAAAGAGAAGGSRRRPAPPGVRPRAPQEHGPMLGLPNGPQPTRGATSIITERCCASTAECSRMLGSQR